MPTGLVEFLPAAPQPEVKMPVLVLALEGFLDAGNASALAMDCIGAKTIATLARFNVDELHDYRARRPPLTFKENHYQSYEPPQLDLKLAVDRNGKQFLILNGPEPDIRWEAFSAAMLEVVQRFNVRMILTLGSIPMAVPHTRPIQITHHANRPALRRQNAFWIGEVRVPASAQSVMEIRLGEHGVDVAGIVAHIPHYLAHLHYSRAAEALVKGIEPLSGLAWDTEKLALEVVTQATEITDQISDNSDLQEMVANLEHQFDAARLTSQNLLADDAQLPSADELGARFEEFLAELDDGDPKNLA